MTYIPLKKAADLKNQIKAAKANGDSAAVAQVRIISYNFPSTLK